MLLEFTSILLESTFCSFVIAVQFTPGRLGGHQCQHCRLLYCFKCWWSRCLSETMVSIALVCTSGCPVFRTEDVILSNVQCSVHDTNIHECKSEMLDLGEFQNSCNHDNDVGVRCYEGAWAGFFCLFDYATKRHFSWKLGDQVYCFWKALWRWQSHKDYKDHMLARGISLEFHSVWSLVMFL